MSRRRTVSFFVVTAMSLGGAFCLLRGTRPTAAEYVLVPDLGRYVAIDRGNGRGLIGTIDDRGNFLLGRQYNAGPFFGNSGRLVNRNAPRKMYEYRSGRLVLGTMTCDGHFVPEVGSKVVAFEDYHYHSGAIEIWNLPGRYLRKDELEEQREWLSWHMNMDASYWEEEYFNDKRLRRPTPDGKVIWP